MNNFFKYKNDPHRSMNSWDTENNIPPIWSAPQHLGLYTYYNFPFLWGGVVVGGGVLNNGFFPNSKIL